MLAYTITGRSGSDKVPEGEHDHTWHMMGSRMQRILRSVEKDPHNLELIGTLPGRNLGEVREASEIFLSDGARGARVCTVLFKRGPGRKKGDVSVTCGISKSVCHFSALVAILSI